MNINSLRKDFPILTQTYHDKPLVYLDNAATSQKPRQVLDAIREFYETSNANVSRGTHFMGERATKVYEAARASVAKFVGAEKSQEIIFTANTTASVNLVAYAYVANTLKEGDEILLTAHEHHSNIVPWQIIAKQKGLKIRYIPIDDEGRFKMDLVDDMLTDAVKFCAFTHVSNVLGVINDVKTLVSKAKAKGVKTLVDGSQAVPHFSVDVQDIGCDFYVFTGHKMCGPMGIGVLYGRKDVLESMPPFMGGGGMIDEVFADHFTTAELPACFEAGTPNAAGAVGLQAAIEYLYSFGFENIAKHEQKLGELLLSEFAKLGYVSVHGPKEYKDRLALISFSVEGVHPHDVAEILNSEAICVRAGHHCCQPLMGVLDVSATTRVSPYFYNTEDEIMKLIGGVEKVYEVFS